MSPSVCLLSSAVATMNLMLITGTKFILLLLLCILHIADMISQSLKAKVVKNLLSSKVGRRTNRSSFLNSAGLVFFSLSIMYVVRNKRTSDDPSSSTERLFFCLISNFFPSATDEYLGHRSPIALWRSLSATLVEQLATNKSGPRRKKERHLRTERERERERILQLGLS
jgi:hypothetical protein